MSENHEDATDGASRAPVTESPFEALGDLDFHAEFHRRYPRGAIVESADELHGLVKQAIASGAKIRTLESTLHGAMVRQKADAETIDAATRLVGEVAIRRFLDNLAEAGLPATIYQSFNPAYRSWITRKLNYYVERANALLGEFHAIPPAAIVARDAKYAERDAANDSASDEEAADLERDLFSFLAGDDTPDDEPDEDGDDE